LHHAQTAIHLVKRSAFANAGASCYQQSASPFKSVCRVGVDMQLQRGYTSFCTEGMAKAMLFLPVEMAPGHYVDARDFHDAIEEGKQTSGRIKLREYMQKVRDAGFDEKKLTDLAYNPNDKDCGYRSGLKFLGLWQTEETDRIADEMIYESKTLPTTTNLQQISFQQMELF